MTSKMTLASKDFAQSPSSFKALRKLPHLQVSSAGHSPVTGPFSKLVPLRLFTLILNVVYMCLPLRVKNRALHMVGTQMFVSI